MPICAHLYKYTHTNDAGQSASCLDGLLRGCHLNIIIIIYYCVCRTRRNLVIIIIITVVVGCSYYNIRVEFNDDGQQQTQSRLIAAAARPSRSV